MEQNNTPAPTMNQGLKLALEAGPLVVFFIVNAKMGIFTATAVFMAVTVVALAYSYWKTTPSSSSSPPSSTPCSPRRCLSA